MPVITTRLLEGRTLEQKREMAGEEVASKIWQEEVRQFRRDLIHGRF